MAGQLDLAQQAGMDALEELETELLLEGLYQFYGDDFRGYDKRPLKAKLQAFMRGRGRASISGLQELVMHDAEQARALMRDISQTHSALFAQPAHFLALSRAVLPLLRSCPQVRIWVAECTSAEAVMSLAIWLEEEGLYERSQIFATSVNADLLADVSALGFGAEHLAEYGENYRQSGGRHSLERHCEIQDQVCRLLPALRRNIIVAQHDLAGDASFNEFQLIVCQRPLADFGMQLQRRVLRLFTESLCIFGVLQFAAFSELDDTAFGTNYKTLSSEHWIYQRNA